jgi:Kip1 ubiquitination-promoting complex protein 1
MSVGAQFTDGHGNLMIPVLTRMLTQQQQQQQLSPGPFLVDRIPGERFQEGKAKGGPLDAAASLIELLDGLILFYHVAAHKQLAKV